MLKLSCLQLQGTKAGSCRLVVVCCAFRSPRGSCSGSESDDLEDGRAPPAPGSHLGSLKGHGHMPHMRAGHRGIQRLISQGFVGTRAPGDVEALLAEAQSSTSLLMLCLFCWSGLHVRSVKAICCFGELRDQVESHHVDAKETLPHGVAAPRRGPTERLQRSY